MPEPRSKLALSRFRPPLRRVLAVDAGSRRIKLLLAETCFGRLRLLKQELTDLPAEGLVSTDEIRAHLHAALDDWANPPLALVLPERFSTSQVVDLPSTPGSEVENLIADEAVKLGGVSESRIIYDFVRTEAADKDRQQFWVTLCREGDIRERLLRLGIEQQDVCDVTTTANALIAAYRATSPLSPGAVLLHLGAQATVVVVLLAGQGTFAASFEMGSDFFTCSLARLRQCSEAAAESLKCGTNLLSGPEALPEFAAIVDGWAAEVKRQLQEWSQHNPALAAEAASLEMIASGGGFEQPGLLDYLLAHAGLRLLPWPSAAGQPGAAAPAKGFEVAFGAAWQALGYSPQPVSLLPDDYRRNWRKRLNRQRLDVASVAVALVCLLVLAFGVWQKLMLIHRKEALLAKVQAGQEAVEANEALTADLFAEYENLRPVLAAQQQTMATLQTLSLLEQSRTNRDFWYVLVADQTSYFHQAPAPLNTNRPVKTNLLGSVIEPLRAAAPTPAASTPPAPDAASAKPGLIAELCAPGEAEATRQLIRDLVKSFMQQPLFSKADLLSDDLRRNLADPKVVVPDRRFVLELDFANTDFQQPIRLKKPLGPPFRPGPRRLTHPAWAAPDPGADSAQPRP